MGSNATRDATRLSTDAANTAAAAQERANAEALAFTKASAQNIYQNTEVNRRGNYDQWAAGQRRLGTLGQMMGLGNREIPGYVSGVDPQYTGASGGAGASFGADQFNARFPSESLSPDQLVAAEADLAKQGVKVLRNAAGIAGKIQLPNGQIVDVIQGAGTGLNRRQWLTGGGTAPAPAKSAGSIGSYFPLTRPTRARTLTPALEMPDPYAPIGRYLGGR